MSPIHVLHCVLPIAVIISALQGIDATQRVLSLTEHTFNTVIAAEKLVFVKFCDQRLEKCQMFADAFEKAAYKLKGTVKLANIDITQHALITRHGIVDMPTVKVFSNGELVTDYKGGLDSASIISFAHRVSIPPYIELRDARAFDRFVHVKGDASPVIAVLPAHAILRVFKRAAFTLIDAMPAAVRFALVTKMSVVTLPSLSAGNVYVLHPKEHPSGAPVQFEPQRSTSFEQFIWRHAWPAWSRLDAKSLHLFTTLRMPVVIGFFRDCTELRCRALERVARARAGNGKLAFAWADPNQYPWLFDHVAHDRNRRGVPIFAYSFKQHTRYVLPDDFHFSERKLAHWVDGITASRVLPFHKSEKVPSAQATFVHVVVGATWFNDVENARMDVFVVQLVPHCARSIRMHAVLDSIATTLRTAGVAHIRIAKMDASLNDPSDAYVVTEHNLAYDDEDLESHGFPAAHFFSIGSRFGLEYDGRLSAKAIVEFLLQSATRKFAVNTRGLDDDVYMAQSPGHQSFTLGSLRENRVEKVMEKWRDLEDDIEPMGDLEDGIHSEL